MIREVAIIAAVVALQVACPEVGAAPVSGSRHRHPAEARVHWSEAVFHRPHHGREGGVRTQETLWAASATRIPPAATIPPPAASGETPISLSYQLPSTIAETLRAAGSEAPPVLTYQEMEVSRLAAQNGDRNYLMVDKALGRIVLFENGTATFSGGALTGASMADSLPPDAKTEDMADLNSLDTKVTPAGRYTVVRHFAKEYGPLFDVAEIRGKDWGIAIHRVYLGIPSEHREARLQSPSVEVKHITFGCINVAPTTLQVLLKELPETGATPLYILPEDPAKTTEYFAPRTS
jgi:hypothetical protein